MTLHGWVVTENLHVMPTDDLREHAESVECWCTPYEDDGIVVHNSADQRETFETGRKMS